MKIVHLSLDGVFADGFSYQENLLTKYHVKMGYEVTVIASLVSFDNKGKKCILPEASEYMDPAGFKVIRLAYRWPQSINVAFRYYVGLNEKLEKENPDIIYSHNLGYGDTKVVANYLKKHPSTKFYCDNHVDYINCGTNWINRQLFNYTIRAHYAKKLIPYVEKCFGVTPMRCRYVKDIYGMPEDRVEFLPMGVDDEAIPTNRIQVRNDVRKELGLKDNDFVVITGGKIDKLKNTHVLLKALKMLNDSRVHLIICGLLTEEMTYLKDVIDSMSNVHHLGWCNAERVMNCMVASDFVCFPGTHSTLWEQAVGLGLPGIFKLWNEIDHVNVNGNCIFVKGEDSDELCESIKSVVFTDKYCQVKDLAREASVSFLYSDIAKKAIGL